MPQQVEVQLLRTDTANLGFIDCEDIVDAGGEGVLWGQAVLGADDGQVGGGGCDGDGVELVLA